MMSNLQVPGATIAYDLLGNGPLILFIAGGGGTAAIYQPIADELKDRFTVLTYDRRGFSRSTLTGEQDYSARLQTDAADAARLIEHVGMGPAVIFGSSSGAIVALTVLSHHPDVVRILVAHEPPVTRFHPDAPERLRQLHAFHNTYRIEGMQAARQQFMQAWPTSASDQQLLRQSMPPEAGGEMAKNMSYWFEHELRQYPSVELDIESLKRNADRLLLIMGGEETQDRPTTPIIKALASALDVPLHQMPGGHMGYSVKVHAFVEMLVRLLSEHNTKTHNPPPQA